MSLKTIGGCGKDAFNEVTPRVKTELNEAPLSVSFRPYVMNKDRRLDS